MLWPFVLGFLFLSCITYIATQYYTTTLKFYVLFSRHGVATGCTVKTALIKYAIQSPVTCHLSPVTCHLSPVNCHLPPVTCHLSPVTCHLSPVTCHLSRQQPQSKPFPPCQPDFLKVNSLVQPELSDLKSCADICAKKAIKPVKL